MKAASSTRKNTNETLNGAHVLTFPSTARSANDLFMYQHYQSNVAVSILGVGRSTLDSTPLAPFLEE